MGSCSLVGQLSADNVVRGLGGQFFHGQNIFCAEIFVVDSQSTDGSQKIAAERGARLVGWKDVPNCAGQLFLAKMIFVVNVGTG